MLGITIFISLNLVNTLCHPNPIANKIILSWFFFFIIDLYILIPAALKEQTFLNYVAFIMGLI